jgi:hypothetical protein
MNIDYKEELNAKLLIFREELNTGIPQCFHTGHSSCKNVKL